MMGHIFHMNSFLFLLEMISQDNVDFDFDDGSMNNIGPRGHNPDSKFRILNETKIDDVDVGNSASDDNVANGNGPKSNSDMSNQYFTDDEDDFLP